MSDNKRSFWSSIPGLITGLAGLLTGIVGLITLLVQQGIVGHSGATKPSANGGTTVTSAPTVTTTSGSGTVATTPTSEVATFSVTPLTVDFPATDQSPKTVTVKNTSTSAKVNVQPSIVNGTDSDRFLVSATGCSSLPANGTCTLKVTFAPPSGAALKKYSATLRVAAAETARVTEVTLTASTLL